VKCGADPGCAAPACGAPAPAPAPKPTPAAAQAQDSPTPPAPVVDPSAFRQSQRRVVPASVTIVR
jgi:hypothetical protein